MAIKELAPWNDLRDDHSPIFGELIFGKRYICSSKYYVRQEKSLSWTMADLENKKGPESSFIRGQLAPYTHPGKEKGVSFFS